EKFLASAGYKHHSTGCPVIALSGRPRDTGAMKNRRMVIAAAGVAAGIVLLGTLLAGPQTPPPREQRTAGDIERLDLDTDFKPAEDDASLAVSSLQHETEHFKVVIPDPDSGRTIVLSGDHVTPQAQFAFDVDHPRLRIIFSPARIIEVSGDRGL